MVPSLKSVRRKRTGVETHRLSQLAGKTTTTLMSRPLGATRRIFKSAAWRVACSSRRPFKWFSPLAAVAKLDLFEISRLVKNDHNKLHAIQLT